MGGSPARVKFHAWTRLNPVRPRVRWHRYPDHLTIRAYAGRRAAILVLRLG